MISSDRTERTELFGFEDSYEGEELILRRAVNAEKWEFFPWNEPYLF